MGGVKLFLKCRYKEILVGLELRLDQCKHKPMGLGSGMGLACSRSEMHKRGGGGRLCTKGLISSPHPSGNMWSRWLRTQKACVEVLGGLKDLSN